MPLMRTPYPEQRLMRVARRARSSPRRALWDERPAPERQLRQLAFLHDRGRRVRPLLSPGVRWSAVRPITRCFVAATVATAVLSSHALTSNLGAPQSPP